MSGNGTLHPGEPGELQGWTVELLDSTGNILATTTSAADGSYSFADVAPGTYKIEEILAADQLVPGRASNIRSSTPVPATDPAPAKVQGSTSAPSSLVDPLPARSTLTRTATPASSPGRAGLAGPGLSTS